MLVPRVAADAEVPVTVLVFGSGSSGLSGVLARRCGGTLVDDVALRRMAEETPSEEGVAYLATVDGGGIPTARMMMAVLKRGMSSHEAPYVLDGVPRMGTQIKLLDD